MLTKLVIFLLMIAALLAVAVLSLHRQRQDKKGQGQQVRAAGGTLAACMLGALKKRPGDVTAVIGHVIAALIIFFGIFSGMSDWTSEFFISPFPWGLLFVAGVLTWIGVILHRAMKGTYTVLTGLGAVLLFLVVTCVFVQAGRLCGTWAGWNIFGSDPHTYTHSFISVGLTEDHAYEARVPLNEESHTSDFELRKGQVFKLLSIVSDGAAVTGIRGNGYEGCNARGAVADTGDGVLRNLIAGTEALKYEARLWTLWRRRPPNNPVRTDEITWNVPQPKAPYGALLIQLDGKKRFLEIGDEITVHETQTLIFFINLERKKFTLNQFGRPTGAYLVKFVIT